MSYREHMKKGECLLNAIVWTVLALLNAALLLMDVRGGRYDEKEWICFVLLLVIYLTACVFHWHRYLAYDKKKKF